MQENPIIELPLGQATDPQHDAFMSAICENPLDEGPRLVFADWLEERGKCPRSEIIRVQCAIENTPPMIETSEPCSQLEWDSIPPWDGRSDQRFVLIDESQKKGLRYTKIQNLMYLQLCDRETELITHVRVWWPGIAPMIEERQAGFERGFVGWLHTPTVAEVGAFPALFRTHPILAISTDDSANDLQRRRFYNSVLHFEVLQELRAWMPRNEIRNQLRILRCYVSACAVMTGRRAAGLPDLPVPSLLSAAKRLLITTAR